MLLFPFYAVLLWYFAGKYRRTWRGVLVLFLGLTGLATVELILIWMGMNSMGLQEQGKRAAIHIEPWDVVRLLIPFGILVMVVAIFIFCLPYPPPAFVHCRKCRYNLTGLEPDTDDHVHCPECGTAWTPPVRCPYCGMSLRDVGCPGGFCAGCHSAIFPSAGSEPSQTMASDSESAAGKPPGGAEEKHDDGHSGDQQPAHHADLRG